MYRTSENEAVCLLGLVKKLVHAVVHEAAERGGFSVRTPLYALRASEASGNGLHPEPDDFGFYSGIDEFLLNLLKSGVGAAFLVRAAVDE